MGADLGLTICYWCWANGPEVRAAGIPAITNLPGWYTRDEFIERYARKTGRDVSAVVRFHRGQTNDERFRDFGGRARALVELAASLAARHG